MQAIPLVAVGAWLGAGLLVLAGWAKLRRPHTSGRALRLAGRTVAPAYVRLLGVGEIGAGMATVLIGGWTIAAQAVLYLAFTGFVLAQRGAPTSSCGCFGTDEDVPVTWLHVTTDASLAVAAIAAVVASVPGADPTVPVTWLVLALVVVAVLAVRMLLVELPILVGRMARMEATS